MAKFAENVYWYSIFKVDINGIGTDGHLMMYHNSWKELASLQTSNFRM